MIKAICKTNCSNCNNVVEYYSKSKTQIYCIICNQKVGSPSGNYYRL
jgi:ribosomal protein S27E